jgi:hypothetical protein
VSIDPLAERLSAAADLLTTVDRSVPGLAVSAGAFGADDAGVPGRIGHELHTHWGAVLAARSQEAADVASRLTDLAQSVRTTSQDYTHTDEVAARRFEREQML